MLQSSFRPGEPPWRRPGCYDWPVVTVQAAGVLVIVVLYTAFFLTGVRSGGSCSSSTSDSLTLDLLRLGEPVNTHFRKWWKRKVWDSSTRDDLRIALKKFFRFLASEKGIVKSPFPR